MTVAGKVIELRPTLALAILTASAAVFPSGSSLQAQGREQPALRPGFGSGRLWRQPDDVGADELVRRLRVQTDGEVADSMLRMAVDQYLEQRRSEAELNAVPSKWSTSVLGQTIAMDQAWIQLGPVKLPTALLALLPLNLQGNPTEAARAARLQMMREDLLIAASRNAGLDGLMESGRQIRAEVESRREFERNRRTPPPGSGTP